MKSSPPSTVLIVLPSIDSELADDTLNPTLSLIYKDTEEHRSQDESLVNTTHDQPPFGHTTSSEILLA